MTLFSAAIVATISDKLLAKFPFFRDFPLGTNAGGSSGLGFDIKQANQKERGECVKYDLHQSFLREDIAAEFMKQYPESVTVESTIEEILARSRLNREKTKYRGDVSVSFFRKWTSFS